MFIKELINLELAVYFETITLGDICVFVPIRPILGNSSEDKTRFKEITSGQIFVSTDLLFEKGLCETIQGFNYPLKLNTLRKKHFFKKDSEILSEFWSEFEKCVGIYDDDIKKMVLLSPKDFEENFGFELPSVYTTRDINIITKALLENDKKTLEKYPDYINFGFSNNDEKEQSSSELSKPINEAIEQIKKEIISQDEAIKKLVVAIYKNFTFDDISMKSNCLLYGPTGVGKTALVKTLAKVFDIPVWIEDMTRYTETGYKGANIEDILINLYNNAGGDLKKAQRSILYLDEIDKKASVCNDMSFNKADVLKSLLKIVEGGVFELEIAPYETISFDTSNLTIIAGGAFTDIYKSQVDYKKSIGFNNLDDGKKPTKISKKNITIKDFEQYGMPIEFLGRFKTIIRMNELKLNDYVAILKNSNLSALKNYIRVFKEKGIDLCIPEELYEKIANIAISYETGARSLNTVVDQLMENVLLDFFTDMDIEKIELFSDITESKNSYALKKRVNN